MPLTKVAYLRVEVFMLFLVIDIIALLILSDLFRALLLEFNFIISDDK